MQDVGFSTLSRNEDNIDLTSFNIVFPIASVTQGAFFCKAATGPNNAACAAVPAFFAIAVFFVAATTFEKTSLYNTFKPEFNLGASDVNAFFVKLVVNVLVNPAIFFEPSFNNLFFKLGAAFLYCEERFFT